MYKSAIQTAFVPTIRLTLCSHTISISLIGIIEMTKHRFGEMNQNQSLNDENKRHWKRFVSISDNGTKLKNLFHKPRTNNHLTQLSFWIFKKLTSTCQNLHDKQKRNSMNVDQIMFCFQRWFFKRSFARLPWTDGSMLLVIANYYCWLMNTVNIIYDGFKIVEHTLLF